MRSENEQLADELVQSWNQHSENKLELSRECELGKRSIEQESVKNEHCAIEAKHVKWEVKEMRLLLPYIGAIEFHGVARETNARPIETPILTTWSGPGRTTILEGTITKSHASDVTREPKDTLGSLRGHTDSSVDTFESSTATASIANPTSLSETATTFIPSLSLSPISTVITPRVINTFTVGAGASGTQSSEHTSIRVLSRSINVSPLDVVPGTARSGSDGIPASSTLILPPVYRITSHSIDSSPGRITSESSRSILPPSIAETSVARTVEGLPIHG